MADTNKKNITGKEKNFILNILIPKFRQRARMYKTVSIGTLVLIIVILTFGIYLFLNAQEFAGEVYGNVINKSAMVFEDTAHKIQQATNDYSQKIIPSDKHNKETLKNFSFALTAIVRKSHSELMKNLENKNFDFYKVLNGNIIRVASVIFLIFGIQILISLYKENMRICSFYNAVADCLEYSTISDQTITMDDIKKFMPTFIDIDKYPQSPTSEILKILEKIKT